MVDLSRNRWKTVAAIESVEQQEASIVQRWRQLNAIIRMAGVLGLQMERDEKQKTIVHRRWNYLRNLYLAEPQRFVCDLD